MVNSIYKKSNYIFSDFYDTFMFREIHSSQLLPQWAKIMSEKYAGTTYEDWLNARKQAISFYGNDECAIPYDKLVIKIVEIVFNDNNLFEEVYNFSLMLETYLDYSTLYVNKKILKQYKKLKSRGKKIVLVTDYYLPKASIVFYLEKMKLNYIFDHIFVSSEFSTSKSNGELYKVVLEDLKILPTDAIMIGDSKLSDYMNAKKFSIKAKRYFPLFHKIKTNISKKFKTNYSKKIISKIYKKSKYNSLFTEYSLPLYYFETNLYLSAKKDNCHELNFLSRGGYLLKKMFDIKQQYLPIEDCIKSNYLYNSRKVNRLANNNDEDRSLLQGYLAPHIKDNKLYVVDEGWHCSSQLTFSDLFGYDTYGYYLGIMGLHHENEIANEVGILFEAKNKDIYSTKVGGI